MIDKQQFAEGMAQLGAACAGGREIEGPVIAFYYGILSPRLTNEQWCGAVQATAATERFWPSPAVILEKAGMSLTQLSETALRVVTDALFNNGGYRHLPTSISLSWDAATWAGVREVGGLAAINTCNEDRWPAMQRKFQRAYEAALLPRPALTTGEKPQQRTLQIVAHVSKDMQIPKGDR